MGPVDRGSASEPRGTRTTSASELDQLLTAQILVAWAGEGGEDARLGWWRTDLVSEFGGEDLFRRLLPNSWMWAVLEAAREAARRRDAELRNRADDADRIVSLYHLGFAIDERLDERLRDLKRSQRSPEELLPELSPVTARGWDRGTFEDWLAQQQREGYKATPIGRRLPGAPPANLGELSGQLVGSLLPLGSDYPLPHYRAAR
jgi:hypothetical protein